VAQELLTLAQKSNDTTALLMGHRILGMSLFVLGELTASKQELQKAIALYDPAVHAPMAVIFSQDFKATAQAYLGLATVLSGDAESAGAAASAQHLLRSFVPGRLLFDRRKSTRGVSRRRAHRRPVQ
jgi:hypothetical protein